PVSTEPSPPLSIGTFAECSQAGQGLAHRQTAVGNWIHCRNSRAACGAISPSRLQYHRPQIHDCDAGVLFRFDSQGVTARFLQADNAYVTHPEVLELPRVLYLCSEHLLGNG